MVCPSIVVIGASAGGLEAVTTILRALPQDFPLAVFVVIHTGRDSRSILPDLLRRTTKLAVKIPDPSESIRAGHVYIARPDCHMLIDDSHVRLTHGPLQHGFRPAVDPLFISAAQNYRECVIGIVLSGGLDDGTAGLQAIKRTGGIAIVQNPEDALVASMPLSALRRVSVDEVLSSSEIGPRLVELAREHARRRKPRRTTGQASGDGSQLAPVREGLEPPDAPEPGPPGDRVLTPFTCPNCGGALWEVEGQNLEQYECHVGHRFSDTSLASMDDERTENLLWAAVRALKEDAGLRRRMAGRANARGMDVMANKWFQDALIADRKAQLLRDFIEHMGNGDAQPAREPRKKASRRAQTATHGATSKAPRRARTRPKPKPKR